MKKIKREVMTGDEGKIFEQLPFLKKLRPVKVGDRLNFGKVPPICCFPSQLEDAKKVLGKSSQKNINP